MGAKEFRDQVGIICIKKAKGFITSEECEHQIYVLALVFAVTNSGSD